MASIHRPADHESVRFIKARMERWVADEPQPGLVEVSLVDAYGKKWIFVDKTASFSRDVLTAASSYPRETRIGCEELRCEVEPSGREIVTVTTARLWSIETIDAVSEFAVERSQIVDD